MAKTVIGIFQDRVDAESAIDHLQDAGYNPQDISIVMKDSEQASDMASSTGANVAGGAVTGAATGGVVGGLAGLLVGLGAIAVPGIGGLLIGGPLAAALGLTGAAATTVSGAATGALAGGLLGSLVGLGIPEGQARIYEEHIREGGILIAVPALYGSEEVADILQECGADQINYLSDSNGERSQRSEDIDLDYRQPYDQSSYGAAGLKGGRSRTRSRLRRRIL